MDLKTYEFVLNVLKMLIKDTKFENHVYSVGGCERDRLLGNEIKDIDLVIDLPRGGIELAQYLYESNYLTNEPVIYENFGTVMFRLIDFPTIELEAVHTRKETYRGDSRKPETAFGTISEDCLRRDFTINAIYRNISTGKTLDLNGYSRQDLIDNVIRTCGDPNIIFNEDSLRILRAIRFKYRLDYTYDFDTYAGMINYVERLSIISQERITDEFSKILCGNNPSDALREMQKLNILKYVFPNLSTKDIQFILMDVKKLIFLRSSKPELVNRLAILLKGFNEESIMEIIKSMKYPNKIAEDIIFLHKFDTDYTSYIGENNRLNLYFPLIRKAMYYAKTPVKFKQLTTYLEDTCKNGKSIYMASIFDIGDIMYNYKLGIDGNDLIHEFNLKPGPIIKKILNYVLEQAFIFPKIYKEKESCLIFAKNFLYNNEE